ncbi:MULTISPECIES: SURF1 family protein [unclassified Knoellia]|uniref:SURF1 family protein n=1 Tax=Knoellia altitudinis TaxID=3404795 RepID=UPI003617BA01
MLRSALKPRHLGLLAVALLIVLAFVQLGRWQLGVAEDEALRESLEKARTQQPVAIESVLRPHIDFPNDLSTRPVSATGTFGSDQVIVAGRRLDGRAGFWVVAPLRVAVSGATLPVLRGYVSSPDEAPPVPSGTVTVTGGLAPPESPYAGPPPPEGQLGSIDTSVLVSRWPGELYNAFVFQQGETPAPTAAATGSMVRVPTPSGDTGFKWRNAAYALQWWVFALFALYLWWRTVRHDVEEAGDNGQRDRDEPADERPA